MRTGEIARWTTPSIHYKPSKVALSEIEEIELTLKQAGQTVIRAGKENAQILSDGFLWNFTQEETGMLTNGVAMTVQIDYKTTNGQRYTTRPQDYIVSDSAVNGVI